MKKSTAGLIAFGVIAIVLIIGGVPFFEKLTKFFKAFKNTYFNQHVLTNYNTIN